MFSIENCLKDDTASTLIIAEIGQAHDGSLGMAHAYIDLAKKVGADAVKFQTHIPSAESSSKDVFRVNIFPQDKTRFDYWRRTQFEEEQWAGLSRHANDCGLVFLSSPFSFEAIDLLQKLDVSAWKVASGEINNIPALRYMAATKKPILLSSGMSSWEDLDEATKLLNSCKSNYGLFQCTSSYPCPLEDVGINVIEEMQKKYKVPVGLSDHSGSIIPSLTAVARGASMVEAHLVFSKDCFGPDIDASLTGDQFQMMVEGIRDVETLLQNPIDKDGVSANFSRMRTLFGKSLYAKRRIAKGSRFTKDDIILLKPDTGIPSRKLDKLIGHTSSYDYNEGELIRNDEINE